MIFHSFKLLPIIDRMLCEMNSRFSPQNNDVMLVKVCACSPSSDTLHYAIPRKKIPLKSKNKV